MASLTSKPLRTVFATLHCAIIYMMNKYLELSHEGASGHSFVQALEARASPFDLVLCCARRTFKNVEVFGAQSE